MGDTKLDVHSLTSAVVREVFPPPPPLVGWLGFYYDSDKEDGGWFCSGKVHPNREEALCELAGFRPFEGSALVEVEEPASEPAKVECPNCGELGDHMIPATAGHFLGPQYLCQFMPKPAQPEPVAEEMPEAVSVNTWQLEELLKYADLAEVSLRTGFHPPEFLFEPADRSLRQCIDAIKEQRDQWRTHSAQPAKVRMTEELERALCFAERKANGTESRVVLGEVLADIQAVRTQAAEAGKVTLPQVRIALNTMKTHFEPNCQGQCEFPMVWNICRFGIEELDAHEGKGEGRG